MVGSGFDGKVCSDGDVTCYGSKCGGRICVVQSGTGPTKKGVVKIGYGVNGYLFAIRSDTPTRNISSTLCDEAEGVIYGREGGVNGTGRVHGNGCCCGISVTDTRTDPRIENIAGVWCSHDSWRVPVRKGTRSGYTTTLAG